MLDDIEVYIDGEVGVRYKVSVDYKIEHPEYFYSSDPQYDPGVSWWVAHINEFTLEFPPDFELSPSSLVDYIHPKREIEEHIDEQYIYNRIINDWANRLRNGEI